MLRRAGYQSVAENRALLCADNSRERGITVRSGEQRTGHYCVWPGSIDRGITVCRREWGITVCGREQKTVHHRAIAS